MDDGPARFEILTAIDIVSSMELAGRLPTKEAILPPLAQRLDLGFSEAARLLVRVTRAGYVVLAGPPGMRSYHLTPDAWILIGEIRRKSA